MIEFDCKCGNKFSIKEEDFKGYLNWKCDKCGNIIPPLSYTGYTIKGCENTKN